MPRQSQKAYKTEEERWQAVLERDPRAHKAFLYAVTTTGIYCRPICPSRRPRSENLVFFGSPDEAEKAGYRACRRCRPDQVDDPVVDERIVKACRLIEESQEIPSLEEVAGKAGLSPFHFHRLFKKALGVTPKEYADACRLRRLQEGLKKGQPVTDTIYEAGFGSSSRLYEKSDQLLGMTPGQYRGRGDKVKIKYALAETSLGWLMVAATELGVCSLEIGELPAELLMNLQQNFAKARIEQAGEDFTTLIAKITGFLDSPDEDLDLPLDIQGTSFQKRVWKALQKIPPGQTMTYGEMAERLGMPKAARAVARAVASNRIALAVPCHRVVRKDGGLGGYRWITYDIFRFYKEAVVSVW